MVNIETNNKTLVKNTVVLYARMIFTLAISLYTSRLILKNLGVVDFGLYNVIGGIVAQFSFLSAAMGNSTQRFIVFALGRNDDQLLKHTLSSCFFIHFIIGLIIVVLGETVGWWYLNHIMVIPQERFIAAQWIYQFSVLTSFITILNIPFNAIIIAYEKMSVFAIISIVDCMLKLVVAISISYIINVDRLIVYGALILLILLLDRAIYLVYCKNKIRASRVSFLSCKKDLIVKMSQFAGWSLIGNIAWIGYTQGINLLLNLFFGPVVNAARGIAVQIQTAVSSFTLNFQTAVNPQITKSYASGDLSRFQSLVITSSKFSFYLMYVVTLPILIETPQVLSYWLDNVPDYTVVFSRLILIILLMEPLRNPINQAIQSTGNIKMYQIFEGGLLLSIVPLSYFVLKMGATPESVFYVQLLIFVITQNVRIIIAKKQIKLDLCKYYVNVVIYPLIVAGLSSILPVLLSYMLDSSLVSFIIVILSSIITSLLFIYILGLTSSEKFFLMSKIKNYIVR